MYTSHLCPFLPTQTSLSLLSTLLDPVVLVENATGFSSPSPFPLARGECPSPAGLVAIQANSSLICFGQNLCAEIVLTVRAKLFPSLPDSHAQLCTAGTSVGSVTFSVGAAAPGR